MSTPEQQPPEVNPERPPVQPPPDEDGSLVPALLSVYAAYLAWRAAHTSLPTRTAQVVSALGLVQLIGGPLVLLAARAMDWQRQTAGRAGDEFWAHVDEGTAAGVNAGLQAIAEALIWTDQHAPDGAVPPTRDSGVDPGNGPLVPTASDPPEGLAGMVALAVANAARYAVARAAGWNSKRWISQRDDRVRHTHMVLDGKTVPVPAVFTSPSGAKLRYPGDPRAPMSERAGCRCFLTFARR